MKKVIWISPYIPYDTVRHAGGQVENYYIKKLIDSGKFEVRLVSSYLPDEIQQFTLNKSIRCDLICNYDRGIKKLVRNGLDVCRLFFPFDRYGNHKTLYNEIMMMRILRKYRKEGFIPDILIIEWTQSLLSVHCFRKVFPEAKIIGIEEDVVIQSYTRKWENSVGIHRFFAKVRLDNIRREEIRALKECRLIIANNTKDVALLKEYGFGDNVVRWVPYYHRYSGISNTYHNYVVFFGDMRRRENYSAAEWFIKQVMPLLDGTDIIFQVIGGNPPDSLKKLESPGVQVKGYQKDIAPFFENALCMVVPLTLGAGIKIKVLEGMSAGLPVLTNEVGVEGIPASAGRDYIFCREPKDYADAIRKLAQRDISPQKIGSSAAVLMEESMNYDRSAEDFVTWVESIDRDGIINTL